MGKRKINTKICFNVNEQTEIEFHGDEEEPEIGLITEDGLLLEIFGTSEELKEFAKKLYEKVNK